MNNLANEHGQLSVAKLNAFWRSRSMKRKPMFARPRRMSMGEAGHRMFSVVSNPRIALIAARNVLREKYGEVPDRFKKNSGRGAFRRFFHSIRAEAMRLEREK